MIYAFAGLVVFLSAAVVAVTVLATRTMARMERRHDDRVDVLLNRLAAAEGIRLPPAPEPEIAIERPLALVNPDEEPI